MLCRKGRHRNGSHGFPAFSGRCIARSGLRELVTEGVDSTGCLVAMMEQVKGTWASWKRDMAETAAEGLANLR
jgi:hypothetical protein